MSADALPPEKASMKVKKTRTSSKPPAEALLATPPLEVPKIEPPAEPKVETTTAPEVETHTPSTVSETEALLLESPVKGLAPVAPSLPTPKRRRGVRKAIPLDEAVATADLIRRHRARRGDATRSQISKVWLSSHEIDRVDRVRREVSRGEWIRGTILRVAGEGNLPAVDIVLQDDSFQPRKVVVNFRLTPAELKMVDGARGRQARCTWMREAVLRVAYPESEKHAA